MTTTTETSPLPAALLARIDEYRTACYQLGRADEDARFRGGGTDTEFTDAVDTARAALEAECRALVADRERIDECERMLAKGTVRLGILRDRMQGCSPVTHALSLDEIPAWIEEQEKFMSPGPAALQATYNCLLCGVVHQIIDGQVTHTVSDPPTYDDNDDPRWMRNLAARRQPPGGPEHE